MVAKQAWRLLTKKDTLVFKVLSAKYFPDGNFMNSSIGPNPSMTWRSIFSTLPIIRQGLIWTIGDGRSVRIFEDPWIPGNPFGLPLTSKDGLQDFQFVRQLLSDDGTQWNLPLLTAMFHPRDVSKIIKLPLSTFSPPDSPCWWLDPSGQYSVKSTYRLINSADFVPNVSDEVIEEVRNMTLLTSSIPNANSFSLRINNPIDYSSEELHIFKIIWKLKLPKKIQFHLWRISKDFLPFRAKLKDRHILDEAYCTRCGNGAETLSHLFYWCIYAEEIWIRILPNCLVIILEFGFHNWLLELLTKHNIESVFLAVVTLWKLWEYRNMAVHEGRKYNFDFQAKEIQSLSAKYLHSSQLNRPAAIIVSGIWSPPPITMFKINFDGSFKMNNGTGAIGVVIRDSDSELLASLAAPLHSIDSAMMAECRAALMAIRFALFLNLPKVMIEGDNCSLMKSLARTEADSSSFNPIINDCKIFASNFEACRFVKTPRAQNSLANKYSKLAYNYQSITYWTDNFPILP